MGLIVQNLQKALELQDSSKGFIRVGTWGRRSGDPKNNWSFELKKSHNLVKITIDHGDHIIYSLMFTSESKGVLHDSDKFGGWAGGETVSEVIFDGDEEINGINGTVGSRDGFLIISSVSFKTNKRIYGPFGQATTTVFSLPWDKGTLVGFYGLAGYYIDRIGIYLKDNEEILRVGTWGKTIPGAPHNIWDLQLQKNQHLKKITIDHGDSVYSLIFTTQYRGLTHNYKKVGGWNGGETVSEVIFDWNEEINSINGTIALSRGKNCPGHRAKYLRTCIGNKGGMVLVCRVLSILHLIVTIMTKKLGPAPLPT
ncbi:hypothetical protein L1887_13553 [Cichorium endivia]|nr:hypothetical protein L1887_13553 [Cichorium endivia]